MKKKWTYAGLATAALVALATPEVQANQPDSLFLYTYATSANGGRNGLHCAWSGNGEDWSKIGPNHTFVSCDYGMWGGEKRMLWPYLLKDQSGIWHALWSVNERDGVIAHASSADLINWKPQNYAYVMPKGANCLRIEARFDPRSGQYLVLWESGDEENGYTTYSCFTKDFMKYTAARAVPGNMKKSDAQNLSEVDATAYGTVTKVAASEVRALKNEVQARAWKNTLYSENARSDARRFADLKPITGTLTIDTTRKKAISPMLMGIFFEDISRAADGGLYAELVQNRDFEYALSDKDGQDKTWNATHSWSLNGEDGSFSIATDEPIHPNNPHYALLESKTSGAVALQNAGFDGIPLTKGEKYDFSVFARRISGEKGKLQVSLVGKDGEVYATARISAPGTEWKKYKVTLKAQSDALDARLEVRPLSEGTVALDMISLFPEKTFKGRENGLRADLAQVIADLHPRFVRFPGGCVAHGDGLGNMYRWKQTIGPLEARKPQRNLWGYHQTAGLGYYEYFLFCEDIGAAPVPVLAAGVPCQNSHTGGAGQQGGIPLDEMDEYIEEICDLIEYANGDAKTTEWGKLRAQAGHPKPFNLKYIGIGNEDLISDVFEERFKLIFDALKERHPEITVIGTVGPFNEGSDYEEGWAFATQLGVPIVDEHYYQTPGWFLHNQDYYDHYDRNKSQVYLGEYASKGNTMYNALVEAAYLCGIERNGDIVRMTSYAPLLAKEGHTNWNPDLIYFNNTEIKPTPNYYVQQLFGQNSGTAYVGNTLRIEHGDPAVQLRMASSVVSAENGDLIVKLVNILPVAGKIQITLPEDIASSARIEKTTLQGNADDRQGQLTTEACPSGSELQLELPAYSLTVVRISNQSAQ
ncbi:MAG: alpha-L-arabinofuranosidase C-terminal domain-containing protein [Bacteroidaceae bacterium]|jgi:alpha-L-arabinofuranosidase